MKEDAASLLKRVHIRILLAAALVFIISGAGTAYAAVSATVRLADTTHEASSLTFSEPLAGTSENLILAKGGGGNGDSGRGRGRSRNRGHDNEFGHHHNGFDDDGIRIFDDGFFDDHGRRGRGSDDFGFDDHGRHDFDGRGLDDFGIDDH